MPKFTKDAAETTETPTLEDITLKLGEADSLKKSSDKDRTKYKDLFFATATAMLSEGPLARKTVEIPKGTEGVEDFILSHNPGWSLMQVSEDETKAVLEQDPKYLPFQFINPKDGKVYARSVREGSPMLDDDRLKVEDPDLYEEVTDIPGISLLRDFMDWIGGDSDDLDSVFDFAAEYEDRFPRVLKPLDDLSAQQIEDLKPYIYEGPKTVVLNAPRKAKPEEMD